VKPFLLLATRPEDAIADAEHAAFLQLSGLEKDRLRCIRLERDSLPPLDLDDYSGVIVGGSPFNTSDPDNEKSSTQRRVEREMAALLDEIVARDFPFLGACYGIGTLGSHQGGVIDRQFGEAIGAVTIELTDDGLVDPLLTGLPARFNAFVGHKEACSVLPPNAVLLASSTSCPVQAFRIKQNLYATQFHPELSVVDLVERIRAYRFEGYFDPIELDATVARVRLGAAVTEPARIVRNFVERYARN
jgi:GMP synthase (glutamine-hydrolysing)